MSYFTERGVLMMVKAERLRAKWQPVVGDWFFKEDGIGHGLWVIADIKEKGTALLCSGEGLHRPPFSTAGKALVEFLDPSSYIWLPSIPQLQDMCIPDDEHAAGNRYRVLIHDFSDWILDEGPAAGELKWAVAWVKGGAIATPWEFWIAYAQKELNNLIWDDRMGWVKILKGGE
jgi:hypothetical protein